MIWWLIAGFVLGVVVALALLWWLTRNPPNFFPW